MGLKSLMARLQSRLADTPDTSEKNMGYQRKSNAHAGCTPDTPDTPPLNEIHGNALIGQFSEAVNDPASSDPDYHENLQKPAMAAKTDDPAPEPPADPNAWRELAQAYHEHHFGCSTCTAAGRGAVYGLRCGVGAALWNTYQDSA